MSKLISYLKLLLIPSSFLIGFFLGNHLNNLIKTPSEEFVKDIFMAYVTILSIGIPLSFDIVSRVSERFSTDAIYDLFLRNSYVNFLWYSLIGNIVFIIFIEFYFHKEKYQGYFWELSSWMLVAYFVLIILAFIRYVYILGSFTRNEDTLLNLLFAEVEDVVR